MRITVTLDDSLLAQAHQLTGHHELHTLLVEALDALIVRERARRLSHLGGVEPHLEDIPRRKAVLSSSGRTKKE
jgi:hypothetical protein